MLTEARLLALLRAPPGGLVTRPWFDRLALYVVARRYLPLSRAWAAALAARGEVARFAEALPLDRPLDARDRDRLSRALAEIGALDATARAAEADWAAAAFGIERLSGAALGAVEARRLRATWRRMAARRAFSFLRRRHRWSPLRYEIADPARIEARYGGDRDAPARAFAAPATMPEIEESELVAAASGREVRWLRFASPSPVMADRVVARVAAPPGVVDPPTLIFYHGIFVEPSQWGPVPGFADIVCGAGFRLVELETPWHDRRRIDGYYGGEPALARAPLGLLDLLTALAREVAVAVDWCRRTSAAPVALGGLSLGALAAQLVAARATCWPEALRPDGLLLLTVCDHVEWLATDSSMMRALGLPAALAAAGWDDAALGRWRAFVNPVEGPIVPPERIVMLLGDADDVTPHAWGRAMAERWGLPEANLFVRHQGHFSAALGLLRDPAPIAHLAAVLGA